MTAPARVVEVLGWHPPAPGSNVRDRDWRDAGLCAQADPEAFFPEKGAKNAAVKRICLRCPIREQCLNWALENHPVEGIWGGLSERERRRMLLAAVPVQSRREMAA